MNYNYLYITEGGETVFLVTGEPTEVDKKCVEMGQLTIIRLSDMTELTQEETWEPIETGVMDGISDPSGPYHWLKK